MADNGAGGSKSSGRPPKEEYTYGGKKYNSQQYYEKLSELKRKNQAEWWKLFEVLLHDKEAFDVKYPEYTVYNKKDKTKVEKSMQMIWEARYDSTLENPSTMLAFCLDPINFVKVNGSDWCLPASKLTRDQRDSLKDLVAEVYAGTGVGSTAEARQRDKEEKKAVASAEWANLMLAGVPDECAEFMPTLTMRKEVEVSVSSKSKAKKVEIAALQLRLKFWAVHMKQLYPALAFVANRVLRMHATTCAAERNWSLWGNLFQKARNRLGQERAEKLIFIRQNERSLTNTRSMDSDEEVVLKLLGGYDEE